MKHYFYRIATALVIGLLASLSLSASPFADGKKYKLVSHYRSTGAISLGEKHSSNYTVYYVDDNKDLGPDSWWYITTLDQAGRIVTLRNAATGKYLSYTTQVVSGKFYCLTLSDADEATQWHLLESDTNNFVFSVTTDITRYMRLGPVSENIDLNMVKVDKYLDIYTYFNIVDEQGNQVSPSDLGEKDNTGVNAEPEPVLETNLDQWATDLMVNGRELTYIRRPTKSWITTLPPVEESSINLTANIVTPGCRLEIRDGNTVVTSTKQLSADRDFTLAVVQGNNTLATTPLIFTPMPVLNVRHGGSFSPMMKDYVWGHMHLTWAKNPETQVLPAKYKTRGATAATWAKHALNMKLRETETGAEIDADILGMRTASSWILDAMAIDRIKMRNRVCFDLWNQFSKLPYETAFNSRNGTVGTFVEVVINSQYQGIYCISDRINRKLLDLKKPKLDSNDNLEAIRGVLYKSGSWEYTGLVPSQRADWEKLTSSDTRNSGLWCNWELQEPEDYPCPEAWEQLAQLYDHSTDIAWLRSRFHINTVADYHLFIIALCLSDNGNKNEFLSIRNITKINETDPAEYDKSRFVMTPWDLDTSLGGSYDGEIYYNGTYNDLDIADYRVSQNQPFKTLLTDKDYLTYLRNRWREIRDGALSPANVAKTMETYANLFISSRAYAREQAAWPRYNQLVPDLMKEVKLIEKWYQAQVQKVNAFLNVPDGVDYISYDPIEEDNRVFDLTGRLVENPTIPGIYIKAGKKFIVR